MKRILILILVFLMGIAPSLCLAAQSETVLLANLNIMVGDPDGNFRGEELISRAEFMKAAIASSSYKNSVAANLNISPFPDVTASYWAAPYIKLGVEKGLCKGYLDATFKPENPILYEEAVTVMLKLLGYTDEDFGLSWPYGQVGLADGLGITDNVGNGIGEYITRNNVAMLIYNTLDTKMKDSQQKLISVFDCETVENAVIIATSNEDSSLGAGKVHTTEGTYKFTTGFDYSYVGKKGSLTVKNGEDFVSFVPDAQEINEYDVTGVIGTDILLDDTSVSVNENLTVYYKSQTLTYKNAVASASKGDTFTIFKNENGIVDYAMLKVKNADINVSTLDKYIVYSKLDNAVIGYSNGAFSQIALPSGTDAYNKDGSKTTYSQLKSSLAMGDIIYVKRNENGEVDYVSYEEGNITGPVTLYGKASLSQFDGIKKIMKDGNEVTEDSISAYDIAYYIADMGTVLVYSTRVTGIYENATPNKDAPESIVVSGKTYNIESAQAFNKLASGGSAGFGDTVTLLLGRTNNVADVLTAGEVSGVVYGYLVETGTKEYESHSLGTYTGSYAKIVCADGSEHEYITDKSYKESINSIVRAELKDGVAKLYSMSRETYSGGTYSMSRGTFGNYTLADNVNIIDVLTTDNTRTGSYVKVFESRINGMSIQSSYILYIGKNGKGQVTDIILKNVTGDVYTYGVVKKAEDGRYTYVVDGTERSFSSSTTYNVYSGQPAMFAMPGGSIEEMKPLTKIEANINEVTDTYVSTGNGVYPLSDKVVVYYKVDSTYTLIPLSDIKDSDYYLAGYMDKSEAGGGRVRVIIATNR